MINSQIDNRKTAFKQCSKMNVSIKVLAVKKRDDKHVLDPKSC